MIQLHTKDTRHAMHKKVCANTLKGLILTASLMSLTGCVSLLSSYNTDFSCQKHSQGIPCKSAIEIYKMSNDGIEDDLARYNNKGNTQSGNAAPSRLQAKHTIIVGPRSSKSTLTLPGITKPKPVRTPARVMRIYVAPWVTKSGTLIMPSYIYTQIEPRRWTVGVPVRNAGTARMLYPLQVRQRKESEGGQ